MSHTNAFYAFNQAHCVADRLHWGQVVLAETLAQGFMPLTLKIYLQELRDTRGEWELDPGQALYDLEDQAWKINHDYRTQDMGSRPCLYQAQAASTEEWGGLRFYKDVIKADKERTIAIKRRARRAAKYA